MIGGDLMGVLYPVNKRRPYTETPIECKLCGDPVENENDDYCEACQHWIDECEEDSEETAEV